MDDGVTIGFPDIGKPIWAPEFRLTSTCGVLYFEVKVPSFECSGN